MVPSSNSSHSRSFNYHIRPSANNVDVKSDSSLGNFVGACLFAGDRLLPGHNMVSNSKTSIIEFTNYGDLCQYTVEDTPYDLGYENSKYWTKTWCLGVTKSNPAYVEVSTTGYLRIVSKDETVYWQSAQHGANIGSFVKLQDNGNLILFTDTTSFKPAWSCGGDGPFNYTDTTEYHTMSPNGKCATTGVSTTPNSVCGTIYYTLPQDYIGECINSDTKLDVGDYLMNNAKTKALQYQTNGDLCLYDVPNSADFYYNSNNAYWRLTWCLGVTSSIPSHVQVNQNNGRLELVTSSGYVYWYSGTMAVTDSLGINYYLSLQNDGNLVLYYDYFNDKRIVPTPQWACGGGGPFNYYQDSFYYSTTTYQCDVTTSSLPTPSCASNHADSSSGNDYNNSTTIFFILVGVACGLLCLFGSVWWLYRNYIRRKYNHLVYPTSLEAAAAAETTNLSPTVAQPPVETPNPQPTTANYSQTTSSVVPATYQPVSTDYYDVDDPSSVPVVYAVAVPRSEGDFELVSTNPSSTANNGYTVVEAYAV